MKKIKRAKAVLSPGMGSLVFSICQEDLAGAGGSFDKLQLNSWKKILRAIFSGTRIVIMGKRYTHIHNQIQ